MPLIPKQQPPYYSPGTTTPPGIGALTRLNTQFTDVVTTGTTETDLYLYTLPANTLTTNGDTLEITYAAIQTTLSVDHIHRFYFDGTVIFTMTDLNTDPPIIQIQLIRTSTTTARASMRFMCGTAVYTFEQTANTIDYTDTIPIKFTGQCSGAGTIQTYSLTIDGISA